MKTKNQKLKATIKLVKKQRFVEDLLQEDELDVCAINNAEFKHPFKTWFNYNIFLVGVFIKEQRLKFRLFVKKLFNKNK